jgi:type VI secretion system protein ImpL
VPGQVVEAHFAYLRKLVEGEGGAPPALDEAIAALGALHARINEAALSPNPEAALAGVVTAAAPALKAAAAKLPGPLAQALGEVGTRIESEARGTIKEKLNAAWRADILPFCRSAIGGRFPFSRGSTIDASIDDVVRLLGPGAMIDGFVKAQLAPYVDTARLPWRETQPVGLSSGALAQLARARKITASLFAGGGAPKASFNLTPLSLDPNAASVILDVDGQELRYAHGPARPTPLTWPGPGGTNTTRLSFAPVSGGAPTTVTKEGAWSLFRLLHEAEFQRTDRPDLFELTLRAGGFQARFRLLASSVDNPFDLGVLTGFGCPDAL